MSPLDLHVLGTPPAFVLSQDQTLMFESLLTSSVLTRFFASSLSLPLAAPTARLALAPQLRSSSLPMSLTLRNLTSFLLLLCIVFKDLFRSSPAAFGPVPQAASAIIPPAPAPCQHFSLLIVCKSVIRTQNLCHIPPVLLFATLLLLTPSLSFGFWTVSRP